MRDRLIGNPPKLGMPASKSGMERPNVSMSAKAATPRKLGLARFSQEEIKKCNLAVGVLICYRER